jgi:hypothetical protein
MRNAQPPWLLIDLDMLETDAHLLRLHLGWLLEDLRVRQANLDEQADTLVTLTGEVEATLTQLADLDALLARVGR